MSTPADHGVAVYTGVFDPVHLGHLDVIRRGSAIFQRLVVGVGINPEKMSLFAPDERVELLQQVVAPFPNVHSVIPASWRTTVFAIVPRGGGASMSA